MKRKNKPNGWEETADVREVQQRRHLFSFAQYHYAWLREIGVEWKRRGDYALDRFSLMDKYSDAEDIETAGYVSLLTNDNARLHDQITELCNLIGPNPAEMVSTRAFITLSQPKVANEKIVGSFHRKSDLFNVLDWIWDDRAKERGHCGIEKVVKIQDERYMLDMLAMRLTKKDGIGKGVWTGGDEGLGCPVNDDMLRVIRLYYPKTARYGLRVTQDNADDVLQFMGFDDTTEFVYTYQGYCRMRELMSEAMERNERLFNKRYAEGLPMDEKGNHFRHVMTAMMPEIRFD